MKCVCLIYLAAVLLPHQIHCNKEENDTVLSRRRRYLAFPEGSTFVIIWCETVKTILPFEIFYEGVNWGVAYPLPNTSSVETYWENNHAKRRRHRRDLYGRFETLLDSNGLEGRSCIYRALCESARKFRRKGSSLSEEFIKLLFKFPLQSLTEDEPEDHSLYQKAYRRGKQNRQQECSEMFPGCPVSLIDIALGHYDGYDTT